MARRPLRRLNKGTRLKTFEFEGFDETNKEETQGRVRAVNDKEARRHRSAEEVYPYRSVCGLQGRTATSHTQVSHYGGIAEGPANTHN